MYVPWISSEMLLTIVDPRILSSMPVSLDSRVETTERTVSSSSVRSLGISSYRSSSSSSSADSSTTCLDLCTCTGLFSLDLDEELTRERGGSCTVTLMTSSCRS
uniref:Uncharacterized protein n=1 Tax=Cyclophora tenuis TaxID=216820 RepID=A0A7S1GIC9_CYCTE